MILERGVNRSSIKYTSGVILAYVTIAVITSNEESVLDRRFNYDANPNSLILPFPTPAVISGTCTVLSRERKQTTGINIAYTTLPAFNSEGIPAPRVPLPVLDETDDCQIIVRGGAFVLGFSAAPRNGLPPHEVQFFNESQSPIERWTWEFGDGDTSSLKEPSHIYLLDGNYDVTLRSGSEIFGFAHVTKYEYIIVGVRVIIDPMSGKAPLKVRFRFDETQNG